MSQVSSQVTNTFYMLNVIQAFLSLVEFLMDELYYLGHNKTLNALQLNSCRWVRSDMLCKLTILRLGPQFLHSSHVVDSDAMRIAGP